MAAVLSNQPMGYYPPRVLVADARRLAIKIFPLDIDRSSDNYTVENGAIRIRERANGKFTSLRDFVLRTNASEPIVGNQVAQLKASFTSGNYSGYNERVIAR